MRSHNAPRGRRSPASRPATTPAAGAQPPVEAIRQLQRTAGNQAVVRVLARDGFQLETPWLLGGERKAPSIMKERLTLDPEIERRILHEQLTVERLVDHLKGVELPPEPAKNPLSMRDPPRLPNVNTPPPDPADPPGFEKPPEKGSAGMFLSAVADVPAVRAALANVEFQVWGRLSSGQQTTLVTTGVTFGAAALGGFLATPGGRDMLGRLSGIPLPVPKAPWLKFEFSSKADNIGLGLHLDVGSLLPSRFGFGPAGPKDSGKPLYGGD